MRGFLGFAEAVDRLTEAFARMARWALLANALLITGNAFSRKFFSIASASAFS